MTDDYEILPADELAYLRKEIDKLKAKPFGADTDTLIGSIRQLQTSIDSLVRIFAEANNIIIREPEPQIKPMAAPSFNDNSAVLSRLEEQNEKIANGMLNLANLMKNRETEKPVERKPSESGIIPSMQKPLSDTKREMQAQKLPDFKNSSSFPMDRDHNLAPKEHADGNAMPINMDEEDLPPPPTPNYGK